MLDRKILSKELLAIAALLIGFDGFAQTLAPGATSHVDADSGSWNPTAAQVTSAEATAKKFLNALDSGRYDDAYGLLTPRARSLTTEKQFEGDRTQWTKRQGRKKSLVITDLTWSKDPKSASAPGTYVAIGIAGRYSEMDRYCGFMTLLQSSSGGPFLVNRVEETALDNRTANQILKDKGQAYVDQTWQTLSKRCPGVALASSEPSRVSEVSAAQSNLPFDSVADAIGKLKARNGLTFTKAADGSEAYADESSHTVWSFTPPGYYAYPAMIERRLVQTDQGMSIKMSVLCEADKDSCDRLVKEANATNQLNAARMRSDVMAPSSSSP
jgi:hypothetical protein